MWITDGKRAVSDIDGTDVLYPSCADAGVLRRGYYGKGETDLERQSPRRPRHPLCDAGKVRGKRSDPENSGGGQKEILYNYRAGERHAPGGIQTAYYHDRGCKRDVGIAGNAGVAAVFAILAIILLTLSWLCSRHIMERKEFLFYKIFVFRMLFKPAGSVGTGWYCLKSAFV